MESSKSNSQTGPDTTGRARDREIWGKRKQMRDMLLLITETNHRHVLQDFECGVFYLSSRCEWKLIMKETAKSRAW